MPEDTQIIMKCNNTIQKIKPEFYNSPYGSYYPGIVKFTPGKVPAGTYCKVVISSDSADIEWRYTVRSINCNNGKAENVNTEAFAGPHEGFGFVYPSPLPTPLPKQTDHPGDHDVPDIHKSHKKSSSSNTNSDEDDEISAKELGDFKIENVYLGTSPNIVVNLNVFATLMKKARNLFGHVIPPPDFIHSAIWIGKNDAIDDDSLGAVFVYGKYLNKHNLKFYINHDGAKAFVMSFGEFKQRYPLIDPIKLHANKKLNLFKFIEKINENGHWSAKDYNWPTNNCQHFTARLINILKATRVTPGNNDWIDLPRPIIDSLEVNENFLKK